MRIFAWIVVCASLVNVARAAEAKDSPLAEGLSGPEALAVGADGRVYVTTRGAAGKDAAGSVLALERGKAVPFAAGLGAPRGIACHAGWLFVADGQRLWRIDRKGKAAVFADAAAFPTPPRSLHGVAVDVESGIVYVSDGGDGKGQGGAVYRVAPNGKVALVTDAKRAPGLHTPAGLAMDGASFLLLLDSGTGRLRRVKVADGSAEQIADGLGAAAGLVWDKNGRLFMSDRAGGRVLVIGRPGEKPVPLPARFRAAAGLCLGPTGKSVLVADPTAGTVTELPAVVPGAEVDERPLALETALAFPDLRWSGWKGQERGRQVALRPLVLTHAGDGSNRVFVATQHGVIHVFPNDQKATATKVFLDISAKVRYDDNSNEEGFLGLAFHPDYKKNGELYVFYTDKRAKLTNVLSRFRVSRDDPDRADPASEEELLRVQHPFWNHDGGTVCFGPDGYLYLALGDGGAANDPFGNGQNLGSILGKVLRLDVGRKGEGKPYAIPKDNPFVGRAGAKPEVWAYGLRNVWRMAFDRKTGRLWAADVGQNLYEEIDLLSAGGNFGWNLREGLHPFGAKGVGPRPGLIDPIWEYHHDVGKSITGGHVYRGTRLPELDGHYLYADYVTGKIWGLRYDDGKKRVVANRPIRDRGLPIMSFGEDERGDAYLMTYAVSGKCIYRFVRPAAAPAAGGR
ncbi:MAG TPA: PQQ-dependent sugar dehydrogenase [Gemmataceae bacterium]|nr:PQQ-dependent sugar dehydrogenase [Gemmataceae bacterium]